MYIDMVKHWMAAHWTVSILTGLPLGCLLGGTFTVTILQMSLTYWNVHSGICGGIGGIYLS